MTVIINPGTEANASATLANAEIVAKRLSEDLGGVTYERCNIYGYDGRDGWFDFLFKRGGKSVEVQIPGDDPDTVCEGTPFKSRRLYVDGSSWLYGFAVDRAADHLGIE